MARTGRTVHRGYARPAPHVGALRAAATRARLKALVEVYGVRPEIVQAGWAKVRGRKLSTRETWFNMHEVRDPKLAARYQDLLREALKLNDVMPDWRSEDWAWGWYG